MDIFVKCLYNSQSHSKMTNKATYSDRSLIHMTVDIKLSQLNSIQQYIMGLAVGHFLFTKILCINMRVKLKADKEPV